MRPARSFYYLTPALIRSPAVLPLRAALRTPTHRLISTLQCVGTPGPTMIAALRTSPGNHWPLVACGSRVIGSWDWEDSALPEEAASVTTVGCPDIEYWSPRSPRQEYETGKNVEMVL